MTCDRAEQDAKRFTTTSGPNPGDSMIPSLSGRYVRPHRFGIPVDVEFADYIEEDVWADAYLPYEDEAVRLSADVPPIASGLDTNELVFRTAIHAGHPSHHGAGRSHNMHPSPFDVWYSLQCLI